MFVEKLQGGVNLTVCAHRIAAIYETYLKQSQTIQPHFHPDAEELYYLLSGSGNGIMHIRDEEREVEAGDVIYIIYLQKRSTSFTTAHQRLFGLSP
jgi:oxalate decarboxylase/phosphoglucose isomerase-like protein (cupin superfamily)